MFFMSGIIIISMSEVKDGIKPQGSKRCMTIALQRVKQTKTLVISSKSGWYYIDRYRYINHNQCKESLMNLCLSYFSIALKRLWLRQFPEESVTEAYKFRGWIHDLKAGTWQKTGMALKQYLRDHILIHTSTLRMVWVFENSKSTPVTHLFQQVHTS